MSLVLNQPGSITVPEIKRRLYWMAISDLEQQRDKVGETGKRFPVLNHTIQWFLCKMRQSDFVLPSQDSNDEQTRATWQKITTAARHALGAAKLRATGDCKQNIELTNKTMQAYQEAQSEPASKMQKRYNLETSVAPSVQTFLTHCKEKSEKAGRQLLGQKTFLARIEGISVDALITEPLPPREDPTDPF